jgi:hypothetical protein
MNVVAHFRVNSLEAWAFALAPLLKQEGNYSREQERESVYSLCFPLQKYVINDCLPTLFDFRINLYFS